MNNEKVLIELQGVSKDYFVDKKPFRAVNNVSLKLPEKGFIAILGHSGSGKTTLLNLIGGLDKYSEGDLLIDGKSTKDFSNKEWDYYRNNQCGFVFQSYNLIPHYSVYSNVAISLKLSGVKNKEIKARVNEVLERVGLKEYARKRPNQLSGGQMQRVAIARALINNPSIILADEPTGALDSNTSIQIMDLLKEISKNCCVIMVTHNEEIADRYANRIIKMKDGEIISDSNPLNVINENNGILENKKTSMPLLSSFTSSLQNLRTKRGRTIITALACSIGILGVALVLSITNGFSGYVGRVEGSIASSVPIAIQPVSRSWKRADSKTYTKNPSDNMLNVYESDYTLASIKQNNLSYEFVNYLSDITENPDNKIHKDVMSVMFNRQGLDFHFLTRSGINDEVSKINDVRWINQYQSAGSLGSSISSITSLPATIIHELFGTQEQISSLYEVIYGKFPTNKDEMVLIVDSYNRIDFSTMKNAGFYAPSDTWGTISQKQFSFSDIVYEGEDDQYYKTFKVYKNSDFFQTKGVTPKETKYASYDSIKLNKTIEEIQKNLIKKDGSINVDFLNSLQFEAGNNQQQVVKNIKYFDKAESDSLIFENDAKYQPLNVKIVGVIRPSPNSYLTLMPTSLGYPAALKDYLVSDYQEGGDGNNLGKIQKDNWFIPRFDEKASEYGANTLYVSGKPYDGLKRLNEALENVKTLIKTGALTADSFSLTNFTTMLNGAICYVGVNGGSLTQSAGSFLSWNKTFGGSFNLVPQFKKTNEFIAQLFSFMVRKSFWNSNDTTNLNIVDYVAVVNSYSLITSILIFPNSLTTKQNIINYIEDWNNMPTHKDSPIVYDDVMTTITDSLGLIINAISIVLLVFASISLIVSSVMMAIITYVSVIERTKEIGVLRACGARSKDVGRLFEVESAIIGLIAGLIGVGLSLIINIPLSLIVENMFPEYGISNIASLNYIHGFILVGISIVLCFISGFVPSRIAARKNPVVCLRSE